MLPRALAIVAAASCASAAARAGANLPAGDPRWTTFRDELALGRAQDALGGVQWQEVPAPDGPWASFDRLTLRADAASEQDRPYSLPVHPRDIAGGIALSCEFQEGRPCGDGAGLALELDTSAGVGSWLTAAARVRARGGHGSALELDRAYLELSYGPFALQAGRDALALGPAVRSALQLSAHAAPQDGIRARLRPVELASWLRISLFYFLDRLRPPQTFRGTLLDCTRAQLDLWDRVQVGGSRFLQLGGEGAPDYGGFWGFVREHFGRSGNTGASVENNRLSLDVSVRFPELRGARVYYEIDWEDTRVPFFNSARYDADHLLGLEVRAVGIGPWRRLFAEVVKTSWISQEHGLFRTGMTNAGRTLGSPLGPDALSLWLRADLAVRRVQLSPWAEWVWQDSRTWDVSLTTGVFVAAPGVVEHRQRAGLDVELSPGPGWQVSAGVFAERVGNAGLSEGETRLNAGLRAALSFTP